MLDAFEHYFGEYPFARDGYKLVQVPYAGMEHQSAVAYGNHFTTATWSATGPASASARASTSSSSTRAATSGSATRSPRADRADMWIHEGWTTYLETLFVEFHYGRADALRYTTGLRAQGPQRTPIVAERGVNADPTAGPVLQGRADDRHPAQLAGNCGSRTPQPQTGSGSGCSRSSTRPSNIRTSRRGRGYVVESPRGAINSP